MFHRSNLLFLLLLACILINSVGKLDAENKKVLDDQQCQMIENLEDPNYRKKAKKPYNLKINSLCVACNAGINGNLAVKCDEAISGSLAVAGDAAVGGNLSVGSNIAAKNNITFNNGTQNVIGAVEPFLASIRGTVCIPDNMGFSFVPNINLSLATFNNNVPLVMRGSGFSIGNLSGFVRTEMDSFNTIFTTPTAGSSFYTIEFDIPVTFNIPFASDPTIVASYEHPLIPLIIPVPSILTGLLISVKDVSTTGFTLRVVCTVFGATPAAVIQEINLIISAVCLDFIAQAPAR